MNKRTKKKHESIVNRAIGFANKQLMDGVLEKTPKPWANS